MRTIALALFLLLTCAPQASSQERFEILAGVDSVNAIVRLSAGEDVPLDEDETRNRLQTVLELELRKNGIVVSGSAAPYLDLYLTLVGTGDIAEGISASAYGIQLWEYGLPKRLVVFIDPQEDPLAGYTPDWRERGSYQIVTWSSVGGVMIVGRGRLADSLESLTVEMAQDFANDYLRANPRAIH